MPATHSLRDGDTPVVTEVLDVLAYASGILPDAAEGIAALHDAFLAVHSTRVRSYRLNDSTKWRRWKAGDAELVRTWMQDPGSLAEPLLGVEIHGGDKDGLLPPAFAFFHDQSADDPCGYVRVSLPADDTSLEDLQPWLEALLAYPIHWGVVGRGVLWDPGGPRARAAKRWLRPVLQRHPGLDGGQPLMHMVRGHHGVSAVNWLTLLGSAATSSAGGVPALSAAAPATVDVHPWGADRCILQAGTAPEAGDRNRGDDPPYGDVAPLLAHVRAPRTALEQMWHDAFKLETPDWLERFLHA
jgi:hypothetical protein